MSVIHTSRAAEKLRGAHSRLVRLRARDEQVAAAEQARREAAAATAPSKPEGGHVG